MATEMMTSTDFQVMSTISTVRAASLIAHHQNPFLISKRKLNFPVCRGLKSSNTTLSRPATSSLFSRSANYTKCRTSSIVCKAREAVNEVMVINAESWEELVLGSATPVLVDFWAPWCGPCRMIAPLIDELAKEYPGKIICYKLNTDDNPTIAANYGIRSIPTVLFFKDGEKKESVIGAVPKSTLTAIIDKYLEM